MVDVPKPLNNDFLLLEAISTNKEASRAIYLLVPTKSNEAYRLGRGHDADIKMPDISVSRLHATITATKQGFTIRNNNAKFGTLVHIKRKLMERANEVAMLQVGRTKIVAFVRDMVLL